MELGTWPQVIFTIVVTLAASSGFWAFILDRDKRNAEKNKKQSSENKMLLGLGHDRICALGTIYLERGYITAEEYENLYDYLYTPYLEMGGNGSAKRIVEEVQKLPSHKPVSKE